MNQQRNRKPSEKKQLQQELERLRVLSDGLNEIIYVTDPRTYNILFVNDKAKELFGEKIVGEKCYHVFQKQDKPCSFCNNKRIFGKNVGKTHVRELQNRRNERWYRCIGKAIRWTGNRHARYGVAIDITDQKKTNEALRDSEEKFKAITDSARDAIVLMDNEGKISYWNPAAERIFGYAKEEAIGKEAHKILAPKAIHEEYVRRFTSFRETGKDPAFNKTLEFTALRKTGEEFPIELSRSAVQIKGKWYSLGTVRDLTERKQMEKALHIGEERFRSIVENSHDGIAIIDDNFTIIYANDELGGILDYPKHEIVGQDFRKFLSDESKALVEGIYVRRLRGEHVPAQYEFKAVRKNGEKRDVEIKSSEIRDEHGRIRIIGQLLDITERKRTEEERKNFERRLSALNTYGQSLNMTTNMEEIYNLTMEATKKTLGFEIADILIIRRKMLSLVAHRGYSKNVVLELALNGRKGITVRAAKSGRSVYVPDVRKDKTYTAGFQIISEDKQPVKLREASRKGIVSELAVPIKTGNNVLGVLNVESKKAAAFSKEDRKLLEILASHAATAISNLVRKDKLKELSKRLAYLMKSTTEIMNVKEMHQRLEVITKAIRKFAWRRVVISLRDDNLNRIDLVTSGLTSQEVRLLLKRTVSGSVWKDRLGPKFERYKLGEFYYLPWNDPWIRENVHGVPPQTSANEATTYTGVPSRLSVEEMVDWHPQDMLYAPLRTPEGRVVGIMSMDDPVDGRIPTKDSLGPLELFLHQAAIIIENAQLIASLREAREQLEQKVDERTRELKKSQEQLLKAQRLAVIGELAGMVGHDLRNPLTSIAGATYYMKKRPNSKSDGKIMEMLELVEKNIVYSNKIINDLLDYSREMKLDLIESTPKSLIKEALRLVEIPKNIRLVNSTENKPKMTADGEKLKRAIVNLIKNAVDAMPRGGALAIKNRRLCGNVEFTFSDTGAGMKRETLAKLWTPLFTTKAKGMGFGLAISKRIIDAHGGSISVTSKHGKGTTFTVTLPIKPKKEGGDQIWIKPLESSLLTMTRT
jgi:PAS domain S-box-containing protein